MSAASKQQPPASQQTTAKPKSQLDTKNHYEILGNQFFAHGSNQAVEPPNTPFIGIFFSAHWCPPCKIFLPKLIDFYTDLQIDQKPFQIVYIPMDRDQSSFNQHFSQMPWLSIPLDQKRCKLVRDKYQVLGIPCLFIIDQQGRVVSTRGRENVMTLGVSSYESWIKRKQEVMETEEKHRKWYEEFNERRKQDKIDAGLIDETGKQIPETPENPEN